MMSNSNLAGAAAGNFAGLGWGISAGGSAGAETGGKNGAKTGAVGAASAKISAKLAAIFFALCGIVAPAAANYNEARLLQDTQIWDANRVENMANYGALGQFWTTLQGEYIATITLASLLAVICAFALHYVIIGPKHFDHGGRQILAFAAFERAFHLLAALSWVVLVPTGLVMIFGSFFGGGAFVRVCKNLHIISSILFVIAVLPMLVCWVRRMLPARYDIGWLRIVGGYLSKAKRPVPAGKFNFGQKTWFYIAVFGGLGMIATGWFMYFLDFDSRALQGALGLRHIEILRLCAIIHNLLGILCVVFFCVHLYMSVFAIKGAIGAMVTGYKSEDEVRILHSKWYEELVENGELARDFGVAGGANSNLARGETARDNRSEGGK